MEPFIVFWELTRACMLACRHCRAKAVRKRHPEELTTEECFEVVDQLLEFDSKPLLVITGGDPLMREDVADIVSYASSKGFRVAMAFSGTERATEEKMIELKKAGVARIAVSIDGGSEWKHDSFRGVSGTFRMSMKAIENAKKAGLQFQINTTVTRENISELPSIAKLCLELGAVMWDVFFVVPTGRAKMEMMPSPQEFEDILCWLYDLSRRTGLNVKSSAATHLRRIELMREGGKMPKVGELYWKLLESIREFPESKGGAEGRRIGRAFVTDGRGMFFISHIGEVYPSGFLPLVAGNLREKSLKEIYYKSEIFVNLRDADKLKGKCGICEYRKICGGSRARAYAVSGDYLAEEPCCVYIPQQMTNFYSTIR